MEKKRTAFQKWIDETGPKEIAAKLEVDVRTVYHWRSLGHLPRPKQIFKICNMNPNLSYEVIAADHVRANLK